MISQSNIQTGQTRAARPHARRGFVPLYLNTPPRGPRCLTQERRSPMWTIPGLRSLLDLNEDEVLNLIDCGKLGWAFDVGLGKHRMEVRILADAVAAFLRGEKLAMTWTELENILVPGLNQARPGVVVKVTGLFVQRVCNISCTHLTALLKRQQMTVWQRGTGGKGGSPEITAASFMQWLRSRRWL